MFKDKVNFDLFKNREYCKSTVQEFYTYWNELLNIDIHEHEKNILFNGFTCCSILYANSDESFKNNYPTFDDDMYVLIYKFVQQREYNCKNWQYVIEKILNNSPDYAELVGINWVHRHHPQWVELRERGLNNIIKRVIHDLTR